MRAYLPDYQLRAAHELGPVLKLLASGEGWRPIAGGTDLMVLLNAGKLSFTRLVSIREIPSLRHITISKEEVTIGAAVTYRQIREHPLLQTEYPLLCRAASWTGSVANQNRGTLGGNLVNASPAADSSPALLVHDAQIRLLSETGERTVSYSKFHIAYKVVDRRPDELLYQVVLPRRPAGQWRYYSRKVGTRKAQAISKVCIAIAVRTMNKSIADARIAVGSVAPTPLRCALTEAVLLNHDVNRELAERARQILLGELKPINDIRSTAAYRLDVTGNLLLECLSTLT